MRRLLIGLLVLLALAASACNLRFDRTALTPAPNPDVPRVRFLFPENNATVMEGAELTVELLAEDPSYGVARVALLVDEQPHQNGQPTDSPSVPVFTVTMNWLARGIGRHSLTALAFRDDGIASAPVTIVIEVVPSPEA